MNKWIYFYVVMCVLFAPVFGRVNVVASIPDLADMAAQIGGEKVQVTALATGREDLHAVPVRPGFLPILNKAQILLTLGLDAEHAWLPALVRRARNVNINPGRPGWVEVSKGVKPLEAPIVLDRSEGEQHPHGNPHINIGPQMGLVMAQNIYHALLSAMPAEAEYLQHNYTRYSDSLRALQSFLALDSLLQGVKILGYHKDLAYLAEFYGFEVVGYLEPKPGVPPTAGHLREMEDLARVNGVQLIVHNQSQSARVPKRLGKALGIPVVEIANAVGARPRIQTWIQLQQYNYKVLREALEVMRE